MASKFQNDHKLSFLTCGQKVIINRRMEGINPWQSRANSLRRVSSEGEDEGIVLSPRDCLIIFSTQNDFIQTTSLLL